MEKNEDFTNKFDFGIGCPIKKPVAKLVGEDDNIFNLIGICHKALTKAGLKEQASEMKERVFKCGSYEDALGILMEYVEVE